jgi:predicted porin
MKKSLIALAVLAASGASFAQSTVSVYGIADIWLGSVKLEDGLGNNVTTTKLDSGGVSHSRWGFKGSEDLGGGLKANFNLEQGFQLDTGAHDSGSTSFNRYAWVGFSGGFGEVKLGKTATAFDDVNGSANAVFDSALSPANWVFRSVAYSWTPSNSIMYVTPSIGGFGAEVSYALDEKAAGVPKVTSFNLSYGAGPLAAQFAYQKEETAGVGSSTSFTRLGGSYDLGVATLMASYGKTTNIGNVSGADANDYQIGANVPLSAALTLSGSYAKSTDNAAAGDQSRKGFGFAANYTFSKRTSIYGGYTANNFTQAKAADAKVNILAVGVRHAF